MTFLIQNFFESMEGSWMVKQTIYCPQNKYLVHNQEDIKFQKNLLYDIHNRRNKSLITFNNTCYINKKNDQYTSNKYLYKVQTNKLMKFNISKYGINYTEYIYNININFKISIAILKSTQQYISIIFTSYIKKIT